MGVLATFLVIGMAAVLLMLRFIFALDSEIRVARRCPAASVHCISSHRSPSGVEASDSAPGLTSVDSNSRLQAVCSTTLQNAFSRHKKHSEFKRA
jgi:hypothetical protein